MKKINCCLTCGEEIPPYKWFCCPEHEFQHCDMMNLKTEQEEVA